MVNVLFLYVHTFICDLGKVIGIDMGGTRIKAGLIAEGRLVSSTVMDVNSKLLQDHLDSLEDVINSLSAKVSTPLEGIGIAFPGIVDSDRMKILSRYVKYTDAQDLDLTRWAQDRFGVPLIKENDARAALIGEWQYGAGRNCKDLVLLTLGTGVGSAVLLDGRLLRGRNFFAGNLAGHMTINLHGAECNCGNIGCVETEASTWSLPQKFNDCKQQLGIEKNIPTSEMNFESIFNKAKAGDELSCAIRDNCLTAWSLCVINLIHAYDPEKIIIGGGIMKSKEDILPAIRQMVQKHSWCDINNIEILPAEQVEYAGILGMGYLIEKEITIIDRE